MLFCGTYIVKITSGKVLRICPKYLNWLCLYCVWLGDKNWIHFLDFKIIWTLCGLLLIICGHIIFVCFTYFLKKHTIAILSLIRLFKLNNQHYYCCHHKSSWQHYQGKAHLKNCIRRNPDFVFPNCNWSVLLSKKERERDFQKAK